MMDVRLVIVAPPKARKSYAVRLPLVVGRGEEAKFRIQQDSVSRRHCEFAVDDGVVYVTDMGSTNGTLVGGVKIEAHAATAVSSGTEVRVGGTVLRVEYATPRRAAAAPVAPDADTVRLPADEVAAADGEPTAEVAAPEVPEGAAAAAADLAALAAVDPAPPPADGSFDFLGAEPAAPAPADGQLDDFFKSMS